MDEYEFTSEHTVAVGDTFTMNYENKQQGIPKGAKMTVSRLARSPGGVNTYFDVEFPGDLEPMDHYEEPILIVESAMINLLNDGGLIN